MWSLVYNLEDDEYDSVPNVWLISDNLSWYPDKSTKTLKKMAKECVHPAQDGTWVEKEITIVRRDYETYERSVTDAYAKQTGKATLTECEKENRGRGLMKRKKRVSSTESDDSDSDTERNQNGHFVLKKKSFQSKTIAPSKNKTLTPTTSKTTPSSNLSQSFSSVMSTSPFSSGIASRSMMNFTQNKSIVQEQNCRLGQAKHYCLYKNGPITLNSIADGLCELSRNITFMKNSVENSLDEIMGSIAQQRRSLSKNNDANAVYMSDLEIKHEEKLETFAKEWFPIKNLDEYHILEENLKDFDFKDQVVAALVYLGPQTNNTRSVMQLLRAAISKEVTALFSWKGQKKLEAKKLAFIDTKFQKAVFKAIKIKYHMEEGKIEKMVRSWLAQTAFELSQDKKYALSFVERVRVE